MHIHVNDFQVTQVVDPIAGTTTGVQPWGRTTSTCRPRPSTPTRTPLEAASVTLRTEFTEYTGTFVIHCHRLNHEDNGLMAPSTSFPRCRRTGSRCPGANGKPATVQVHDGNGDEVLATVTPFPDFEGVPSVAMADVNGDMILDLIVGTGAGVAPQVVAYGGADAPDGPFKTEIARFAPFDAGFRGGVTVAGDDIDGNALADNIIVGSGPGMESQVKIFSSTLPIQSGTAPEVFSSFTPYPGFAVGRHDRHRDGRCELGPGEHRHRAGAGRCPADQDVPLRPVHPDRAGRGQRHRDEHAGQAERADDDRRVPRLRRGLHRRCVAVDRLGRWRRGWGEEHRHRTARRRRHRAGLVDGITARRCSPGCTWRARTTMRRPAFRSDRVVRAVPGTAPGG